MQNLNEKVIIYRIYRGDRLITGSTSFERNFGQRAKTLHAFILWLLPRWSERPQNIPHDGANLYISTLRGVKKNNQ